jgi:hypothetical protein
MVESVVTVIQHCALGKTAERVVIFAGIPFPTPGATNALHIVRLGWQGHWSSWRDDPLKAKGEVPKNKRSLRASARRDALGVIYPDLPRLTRFNSHPINADGYLIGWRGLLGSFETEIGGMRVAALARTRIPAHNTVHCSKLSPWLAEPRGRLSLAGTPRIYPMPLPLAWRFLRQTSSSAEPGAGTALQRRSSKFAVVHPAARWPWMRTG